MPKLFDKLPARKVGGAAGIVASYVWTSQFSVNSGPGAYRWFMGFFGGVGFLMSVFAIVGDLPAIKIVVDRLTKGG